MPYLYIIQNASCGLVRDRVLFVCLVLQGLPGPHWFIAVADMTVWYIYSVLTRGSVCLEVSVNILNAAQFL